MAYYAVGDIQGCYDPLSRLLDKVNFDQSKDTLLCVGDLVNRGPESLKVLRFLKSLDNQCVTVLGNHDIHLLAMLYGIREPRNGDTLRPILMLEFTHGGANNKRLKMLRRSKSNFAMKLIVLSYSARYTVMLRVNGLLI